MAWKLEFHEFFLHSISDEQCAFVVSIDHNNGQCARESQQCDILLDTTSFSGWRGERERASGECNEIIQIKLWLTSRALLQWRKARCVSALMAFRLCNGFWMSFFRLSDSLMNSTYALAFQVAAAIHSSRHLLLTVWVMIRSVRTDNLWYLDKQFPFRNDDRL